MYGPSRYGVIVAPATAPPSLGRATSGSRRGALAPTGADLAQLSHAR
jgi:hypothetical protein